ncbi:substrate-binding domain-containing protein [Clostridium chromiireducens]|uniref:D-galactose/methyl-galactoside binding periplasmic protein MglB n=1 Tax=Clostridium chromiireducens TaxID=225345 RepID=A0A964W5G8_9CLOT|nr:galactose ABC transporter substrate-binding protein [Clostridium chromiireducens]MVX67253.1 substrate-binding domain-containing protein [Clostridium chromiireducens]
MRICRKMLTFIIPIIMLSTSTYVVLNKIHDNTCLSTASIGRITNIGVLFFKLDDPYMSLVKQSLDNIQTQHEDTIKFTFFDGKDNRAIQNVALDSMFRNNFDLLLIDLVNEDENAVLNIIAQAKRNNIPIILFNFELSTIPEAVKSYNKVVFIATDSRKSGILQSKLIIDKWTADKEIIDKNKDNKIQYIMLKGNADSKATIYRSDYCISTISASGIETVELSSKVCNWDKELAKSNIDSLFLRYGNNLEMIISNNDAMAIGAIEALQKYGYNNGDKTKTIPVFGIDGIPEAKDLISKGFMTGTVIQNSNELAQALYTVGVNLVSNVNPLENTDYKFDKTGFVIEMPYYEYTK